MIGLVCILFFPVALLIWLVTLPFDRRKFILHKFTCFWSSLMFWLNPHWNLKITGLDQLDRAKTRIIASNHLSLVDIFLMFRTYLHFKWISKAENFKIPLVGWNMRLNDYVELKRGSNRGNADMMKSSLSHLDNGSSVCIFPEGTRSTDGKMRKFKKGAFELALRAKKSILPVVIHGSRDAIPTKSLIIQGYHQMKLHILPEIQYDEFSHMDSDELTTYVEGIMRNYYENPAVL